MTQGIFERASGLEKKNQAFVIVSIVRSDGAVPRSEGRMLVEPDGRTTGTIGGHDVEKKAIEEAVEAIRTGRNRNVEIDNRHGKIEVLVDVVNRLKKVFIIGYGNVGAALASCLHYAGFETIVYDQRPFECPFASECHVGPYEKTLSGLVLDQCSALVVTTHDRDEVLRLVDTSSAFYVGAISSRSRLVPGKKLFVPMGLDTGGETPEEIAISVTAEIMAVFNRTSGRSLSDRRRRLVIVRGAGDLATATIIRLTRAGYDVLALETGRPTQVRRNVSFAEAVYEGRQTVDEMEAELIGKATDCFHAFDRHVVPVLVDPDGLSIDQLKPAVVVDAIIAKKNLGTKRSMAPLTIALGPGFIAGDDVDVVIETQRGHSLGAIIRKGSAKENTGIPGNIAGYTSERVVRSSCDGVFTGLKTFGDIVRKGDVIATVGSVGQLATIDGMVRGMLHSGLTVTKGFKIADIDPRGEGVEYNSPSDKARSIAGAVLEAVDSFFSGNESST